MSAKKHIITLTIEERNALEVFVRSHRHTPREKARARILLLADTSCSREEGGSHKDGEIMALVRASEGTLYNVRRRFVERGAMGTVLQKEQEKRKARRLNGAGEAKLIAITCSAPPEGNSRWTLSLLKERLIATEVVESIGKETIRRTLKKTTLSRG